MTKQEYIAVKLRELDYFVTKAGPDTPKVEGNAYLWLKEYIRSSLEEAYTRGLMEGYKQGINSQKSIKKIGKHI